MRCATLLLKDWGPNPGTQSRSLSILLRCDALWHIAPKGRGSDSMNAIAFTLHPSAVGCAESASSRSFCYPHHPTILSITPRHITARHINLHTFGCLRIRWWAPTHPPTSLCGGEHTKYLRLSQGPKVKKIQPWVKLSGAVPDENAV